MQAEEPVRRDAGSSEAAPDREAVQLQENLQPRMPFHRAGTASSIVHKSRTGRLWARHVSIIVPHQGCRDHWANERTVLSYFRTAQTFAMIGVVVAQLMRLDTTGNPNPTFGYFKVSIPLASCCHVTAIIVVLIGTYRFFHWQSEIATGFAISSGWEILLVFVMTFLIAVTFFILCLTIAIERSKDSGG